MKQEVSYQIFDAEKTLSENLQGKKSPLLLMDHLRNLDYPISRGISYERTVDEFLLQLETNDSLRPLRQCAHAVILLGEQGALIRQDGRWDLLFQPDAVESATEATDLYALYKQLLTEERQQKVCRVCVPSRSLQVLVSGIAPFSILDEYCKTQPGRYLAVAQRIVYEGVDVIASQVPVCHYGKLVSADKEEIENYHTIKALLDDYIYQFEHNEDRLQPLSIAVFGSPGCGKSFGVKQIASSSGRFAVNSLNLSQYHSPTEFFEGLREALNCKNSQIPLVFIDEFDSDLAGAPRGWLRYFLAPMQDGEFTLNGKLFEVSAAVFVFAGATASSFYHFLPHTDEEQEAFRLVKGNDFVSRLKGILNIKGPNPMHVTDKSAMIRRAMLLREQLLQKCPSICGGETINISRSLLTAMLSVSEYRHGTRSLELILAMSRLSGVTRFTPSCLPVDEQLNIHVHAKDFKNKLEFEQIMGDMVEKYAQIAHEHERAEREEALRLSGQSPDAQDPELAPWDSLDEHYKESHRSQIRYIGERLQDYNMTIGLRPLLPNTTDAIADLYGPSLELLSEMDHERWMQDKLADGWRLGKYDPERKITPDLVPYAELSEETRESIRRALRALPLYLREIGYELYMRAY